MPIARKLICRKQTVSKIIKNPFYKGMISYSGEINQGNHPTMIDEDLLEKSNRVISGNLPGHRFTKISKDYNNKFKGIVR